MKFFIDQHGCAKNQVDGELILQALSEIDWEQTFDASQADLIIVNSCGFIESAKTESIEAVVAAKADYPKAKILLAGCLAERYATDLCDSLEEADGFFGNGDIAKIKEIVPKLFDKKSEKKPILRPLQKGVCAGKRDVLLSFESSAFVKITEGCNNRCSFCAIPLIRGELRSRKATEIIDEIKSLVSRGIFEINLIGQDLAAFGTGADDDSFGKGRTFLPKGTPGEIFDSNENSNAESGLCALLKEISKIQGEFRIRLLYIHPDHFNEDVLEAIKADSRILHYFDIPFQSGDDNVIRLMNRVGTAQKYLQIVQKIRSVFPDSAIRTTFLAGFPGESEDAFQNTLEFLQKCQFDWSGCFAYSREDGTKAFDFKNRVPKKIAQKRAEKLVQAQAQITKNRLALRCGKEYNVLIEEVLDENAENPAEGLAIARAWFQAPEVDGSVVVSFDRSNTTELNAVKPGNVVRVRIVSSGDIDLHGFLIVH